MHSTGKHKVAVIFTNNSWGKPLADSFTEQFTNWVAKWLPPKGWRRKPRTLGRFSRVFVPSGIDSIVSPTYPNEGSILVRQARVMEVPLVLYGGDNLGSPEFRMIAGAAAEGVFYTAPAVSDSPEFPGFAERYRTRYGEAPDIFERETT